MTEDVLVTRKMNCFSRFINYCCRCISIKSVYMIKESHYDSIDNNNQNIDSIQYKGQPDLTKKEVGVGDNHCSQSNKVINQSSILDKTNFIDGPDNQNIEEGSNVISHKNKEILPNSEKEEIHKYMETKRPDIDSGTPQYLASETVYNLTPTCVICNICCNEIFGLICDHNICADCLTKSCVNQIHSVLKERLQEKGSFSYKCPERSCGKPISVPTHMVILKFRIMMEDRNFRQEYLEYEYLLDDEIFNYIPFFDGTYF